MLWKLQLQQLNCTISLRSYPPSPPPHSLPFRSSEHSTLESLPEYKWLRTEPRRGGTTCATCSVLLSASHNLCICPPLAASCPYITHDIKYASLMMCAFSGKLASWMICQLVVSSVILTRRPNTSSSTLSQSVLLYSVASLLSVQLVGGIICTTRNKDGRHAATSKTYEHMMQACAGDVICSQNL